MSCFMMHQHRCEEIKKHMEGKTPKPWKDAGCCSRCWKAKSKAGKCRCRCKGKHHGRGLVIFDLYRGVG